MNKMIYTNEHKHIVQQLKIARIETNLSQEEVAKLINKTQSYISKIESGQRRIDVIQLNWFAKIYKKDISFFLK